MKHKTLRVGFVGTFTRAVDMLHGFGPREGDDWMVKWVEAMDSDDYIQAALIAANSPGPVLFSMAAYGGAVMCFKEQTQNDSQSSAG